MTDTLHIEPAGASTSVDTEFPAPAPAHTAAVAQARVTQWSVVKAEWIKFRSVRSNLIALFASGALLIALGSLFTALAGSGEQFGPEQVGGIDSLTITFAGLDIGQLVLGVLAAVFVAGEYSTGMIRTMFTAVPDRLRVLWGKLIVVAGVSWVVMTVAAVAVFFLGHSLYNGDGTVYGIGDAGVIRAVAGAGVFSAGVALMGVALGFVMRSTAATIGTLVAILMLAPGLVGLLPDSIGETASKILPSSAGQAFVSVSGSEELLAPGAGFAVFLAWVAGFCVLAAATLRRRDA